MFNHINSIKYVLSFKAADGNLAFNKIDRALFFNFEKVADDTNGYFFFEKCFCHNTADGDTIFWDIEEKRAFKLGFKFNGSYYYNNTFLTSFDSKLEPNNIWTSLYVLYQLFPLKKLREFPNRYIGSGIRFDNKFIRAVDNITNCLSLDTGEYLWKRTFDFAHTVSILGLHNDKLALTYRTHENRPGTLALDIQTGEIVWDTEGGDHHSAMGNKGDSVVHFQRGGFWLNGYQPVSGSNVFREIDINTGKTIREGVISDLDALGLDIRHYIVHGDEIVFTAHYVGGIGAIAIGVLDYDTLSLLWWQEVEMQAAGKYGNSLINQPAAGGNKLYVLDKTHVLHIFERDADFIRPTTLENSLIPFEQLPPFKLRGLDDDLPF